MATKKKAPKKSAAERQRELNKWAGRGSAFKTAERQLRKAEFSHQWKIADWMLEGEDTFGLKAARDAAEKTTGMTRKTLEQFAHTAKKVLIRVKGVSFGHHRLVAKFKGTKEERKQRQKKELLFARKNKLTVERFDLHLRGLERHDGRGKIGRTSTDIAAKKFMETCDKIELHWGLRELLSGQPPAAEHRVKLVKKVRETASKLNETADQLQNHWQLYLPLPPTVGFSSKKLHDEWKSHEDWRKRESAKAAAAGSAQ
jgi:hypothetical protein